MNMSHLLAQVTNGDLQPNFDTFNPLVIEGSSKAQQFKTPGGIVSEAIKFAFPAAGLILFVMIVAGGFEILSGATSPKSQEAAKQRITAAILGFVLLFASYWIVQIVEVVFGVKILG